MSNFEIFLSKLSSRDVLYNEIASKLRFDNNVTFDMETLIKFLSDITIKTNIKLYISNENIENKFIDEIITIFKNAENRSSEITIEVIEDEFLNIIDSSDRITSECKPRSLVHRDGDLHPTVHIWIIKRKDMGIYALLQKRASTKDTHPNCYDVSSAGHVSQGSEYRAAAVRELAEELGLNVSPEKLEFIGMKKNCSCSTCGEKQIKDNEISAVYLYREDVKIDDLILQASEVSEVCWAEIDELLSIMHRKELKHCIVADELKMIKKAVF